LLNRSPWLLTLKVAPQTVSKLKVPSKAAHAASVAVVGIVTADVALVVTAASVVIARPVQSVLCKCKPKAKPSSLTPKTVP
jgi:hypothetical protein